MEEERKEKQKGRFSPLQENLICILTIIGAGVIPHLPYTKEAYLSLPYSIAFSMVVILVFFFPFIASTLIVFWSTQNLKKAFISGIFATLLSLGLFLSVALHGLMPVSL